MESTNQGWGGEVEDSAIKAAMSDHRLCAFHIVVVSGPKLICGRDQCGQVLMSERNGERRRQQG